jgi:anaerobic selenocysteine-containing dehydrogenase
VLTVPNGRRLEAAMAELDLVVSIDPYLNETSRLAHYILPSNPALCHPQYDVIFRAVSIRNTARFNAAVFPVPEDSLSDGQILAGLIRRIEPAPGFAARAQHALGRTLAALGPERVLRLGIRLGPHGVRKGWKKGLTLDEIAAHPQGVDLGPAEPCLPARLGHRPRRIRLAPEPMLADIPRAAAAVDDAGPVPDMVLISRRDLRSSNSSTHNLPRLMKGKSRCTAQVHPEDAERLGLVEGSEVRITSSIGEIVVPIDVTDRMMPGVVSVPHGWGHGRGGVRQRTARQHAGASINDLTDDQRVDPLSGNAALNGISVTVAPA